MHRNFSEGRDMGHAFSTLQKSGEEAIWKGVRLLLRSKTFQVDLVEVGLL